MGSRRKARECALQMLFAADVAEMPADDVVRSYWAELGESDLDTTARDFATRLALRTLSERFCDSRLHHEGLEGHQGFPVRLRAHRVHRDCRHGDALFVRFSMSRRLCGLWLHVSVCPFRPLSAAEPTPRRR